MLRILFIAVIFLQAFVSSAQAGSMADVCHEAQTSVHATLDGTCDDTSATKHTCDEGCLTCSSCHCGHSHWLSPNAPFAAAAVAKQSRPHYTGLVYLSLSPRPLLEPPSIV
jgi:hypothetical protein